MAIVLLRIFDTPAVLAVVDGHPVNDPVGVNAQVLLNCFEENMRTIMSTFVSTAPNVTQQEFINSTCNERGRRTTHMYRNNNNVRQLRCVENAHFIIACCNR